MLKTIRIIILFLVLSGTAFAGPGINTIIAEATFPLNPTDGQAKYGFVFNKALGNWTKLIESGTITSWYDKNANTLQESDELTVKNYKVYQIAKVFSAGVFISNDVKYGTKNENGIMPAQENDLKSALESLDRSGYKKGEYITGVGDRAISGYNDYRDQSEPESNIRITEGVCVAVVGPATVRANVSTLFITEGADKYTLAQNFKFPNWYLEKETLNSKKDGWFLESNKAAVELTRQAVNNIQIWVDQKVGRGNGFKGYYALDLVPFLLKDSEVPKSLVNSGSNQNPSGGSSNVSASLNSKDGKETYSIYLINFGYINESDSTDDQVFTRAHEKFVQETKSLKRPETLTYDGADEAVRMVWRDGTNREAIIFRRDNVLGFIRGEENSPKTAPTKNAMNLFKLQMTKLKGESTASLVNSIVPEKEEVAGIRIKVDNKVFQLDGKNKIAIAVEAKSGLKVKLSLDEKELGGERGGLTIINEVVNADGLANFVYLPPLLAASFEAYKYVYISANVSVPGKAGVLKDAQRMTLAVQKETVVVLDKERKEMTDHYYDELMKDLADLDKKGIKTADFRQIAKTNKLQLLKSQSSEEAMGCSDNIHLMALECRYLKVLYDRQMETNKWFTESLKSGISTLSDLIGVTDKLEAATKARIKKEYSKVPYDNFKKELLATFIENLYTQFEKASDSLKATGYSPEDLKAFKKLGMEYLNEKSIDTFSEFIFSYFKESTIKETQANLDLFVGGIKNRTGVYNADKKVNPSLDLYSTYEKEHNLLNMAHLDRELYRLDTKLLLDTVIKGPLVYFNMKNMVADKKFATKLKNLDADSLSKIYKEFTESPTFLKNISGGIDGMFYSYCGYNWLIDYYKINKIRTDLTALLLK